MAQPEIVINPTSLDFGIVAVGQSKTLNVLVSNYDLGDLIVNVTSSNTKFSFSPSVFTVIYLANAQLAITFAPTIELNYVENIILTTNDPARPSIIVPVTGSGKNSVIQLSTSLLNFDTISIDDTKQLSVTITNIGTVELVVPNISIDNSVFSITNTNFVVQPSDTYELVVSFNPRLANVYSAILQITSNTVIQTHNIDLSGVCEVPTISIDRSSINFGALTINETKTEVVIVTNTSISNIDLLIGEVTSTNSCFTEQVSSTRLHKNQSIEIPVTFIPVGVPEQTGEILIKSNDVVTPQKVVSVSGSGIVASNIRLSTYLIDYGLIELGSSSLKTFEISNIGLVTLDITSISTTCPNVSINFTHTLHIEPGSNVTIETSFSPTSIIDITSSNITVESNDPDSPHSVIALQGQGVSPEIEITPVSLDFGNVALTYSKQMQFTIKNNSQFPLDVSSCVCSNPLFTVNQVFPIEILGLSSKTVTVTFLPTSVESIVTSLIITSNDFLTPVVSIPITANCIFAPKIKLSTYLLDFGVIALNTSSLKTVQITNTGLNILDITNITTTCPSVFVSFSEVFQINPGSTKSFQITFSPANIINIIDTNITVESNDAGSPHSIIALQGQGISPKIKVEPTTIDFGNVSLSQPEQIEFVIRNDSQVPLNVSNCVCGNPLFTINQMFPITINGSDSKTIKATFLPTSIGNVTTSFTITSNDFLNPTIDIPVTGAGIAPEIIVTPSSLDFGSVGVDQSSSLNISISNFGVANLLVTAISNNIKFVCDKTSFVVASSLTTQIKVTFAPDSKESYVGDIILTTNDPDHTSIVIPLTGKGVKSEITIDKSSIDFGIISVNDITNSAIVITNTGNVDLVVLSISIDNPVFSVTSTAFTVKALSSYHLNVSFKPITTLTYTGLMHIISNSSLDTIIINLLGKSESAAINVNKSSINFGIVTINDSKTQNVLVSNISSSDIDLLITNVTTTNQRFKETIEQTRIHKGDVLQIPIIFTPNIANAQTGQLKITSNDVVLPVFSVDLFGQGLVAPNIRTSTNSISFGGVALGKTLTKTFQISNVGVDVLNIVSILSDNFDFTIVCNSLRLDPGAKTDVNVTFEPSNIIAVSSNLIIKSNDPDTPQSIVILQGIGLSSDIEVPSVLNFNNVSVKDTKKIKFTVINKAAVDLVIQNFIIEDPLFTINQQFPVVVSKSKDFEVSFSPTKIGAVVASLQVVSNDFVKHNVFMVLQGSGVWPKISVTPMLLDFNDVAINQSKTTSVEIKNLGLGRLIINSITSSSSFSTSVNSLIIDPQQTGSINVIFSPTSKGQIEGSVDFINNSGSTPDIKLKTTGFGAYPIASIVPQTLSFGNVTINTTKQLSITISNSGKVNLVVTIASSSPQYVVSQTSINVSEQQTISVTFKPLNPINYPCTITIRTNDPEKPITSIVVTGAGILSPKISVTPSSLSFGALEVNKNKKDLTTTIFNKGTLALQYQAYIAILHVTDEVLLILSTGHRSDFTTDKSPVKIGSSSITFFRPNVDQSGIITVKTITLSEGIDYSLNYETGDIHLFEALNRGDYDVKASYSWLQKPIVVLNPSPFSTEATSGTVGINSQTNIVVQFKPTEIKVSEGILRITSNDLNESVIDVALFGTGIAAIMRWETINTKDWLSDTLLSISKSITTVVDPLISALDLTTQILNIVKMFIINIPDVMKVLLETIKKLIDDFIKSLDASGVYLLFILPGKPGITPAKYPQYFRDLPKQNYNIFDPNKPTWFDSVKGGYSSFVAKVCDSMDDPGDGSRPQFPSESMVGAYILMFDSGKLNQDAIAKFISQIQKLMKLFRSPFKVAFDPPSNITAFASSDKVKITFTPGVSLLPKNYFVFRSEIQGGAIPTFFDATTGESLVCIDENSKTIREWDLVGSVDVKAEFAKLVSQNIIEATSMLDEVSYSATEASKKFLANDPLRFVYEDTGLTKGKTYYYVVTAGYSSILGAKTGTKTSDFEKQYCMKQGVKIQVPGFPKPSSKTGIIALGSLSAEISAKPVDVIEVAGGLARCRNLRCNFEEQKTEKFKYDQALIVTDESNKQQKYVVLSNAPIPGSVVVKIKRGTTFTAKKTSYRVNATSKQVFFTEPNYYANLGLTPYSSYKSGDEVIITYQHRKDLTPSPVFKETKSLRSDFSCITSNHPLVEGTVKATEKIDGVERKLAVIELNSKDGVINIKGALGKSVNLEYQYYLGFSDEQFFKCQKPEYNRYFFSNQTCNSGSTLCPGYDNANCYFNVGSGSNPCSNTGVSLRIDYTNGTEPENIPFAKFYDAITCQNSMMQQRCDGYSKCSPRYAQKVWPDWSSVTLSVLDLFPQIGEVIIIMDNLISSLLSGIEKMDTAIVNFIDMILKKIEALKQFIVTINSYLQSLLTDFNIPDLYFLNIPYANGGNDYIKSSLRNSKNGPVQDPTAYTAGVVIAYGTPSIAGALKLIFG